MTSLTFVGSRDLSHYHLIFTAYVFLLFMSLFIVFYPQTAIQKAAEVEANLLKTVEKLEAEIKSREADMDKQQLEHKVSGVSRWQTSRPAHQKK